MTMDHMRTPATDGEDNANEGNDDVAARKTALRHDAFRKRRAIGDAERQRAGIRLADAAERSGILDGVGTVAAYVSMGTEVPTTPMLRMMLAHGIRVLVPRLGSGRDLGWGVMDDVDALHDAGGSRPDEPGGAVLDADAIAGADLVVTAAVLADRTGVRLGRGGGWYDRALARRRIGTPVVAVVWPWELVDDGLPCEPHDQRIDGVLTPNGYFAVGARMGLPTESV
ncbi:5-formyltetrahydrofolate cyclo-ligase [Bifidobacterium catulorum]|nr:5-formyltetrahydrofolate cyclo-ligase [Bifidobacterium catulorum]